MNDVAFNQETFAIITKYSGRGLGRFKGHILGKIKVHKNGSYFIEGTMTFEFGPYNWVPDGNNLALNIAITVGGGRTNYSESTMFDEAGRYISGPMKLYADGKTFMPVPSRTYSFKTTGNGNK